MKVSELLSKPIINLYSGQCEGTIKNVYFDKQLKVAKWLVFFNDNKDMDEYVLDTSKIYNIGNAIIIKNSEGIFPLFSVDTDSLFINPINNSTYDTEGKSFGKIKEINLSSKFVVESMETSSFTIDIKKILTKSDQTIVINNTGKKIKITKAKNKKISVLKKDITVAIQQENLPPKINIIEKPSSYNKTSAPQRIISNNNYLLGRKVTQNIYGNNNEIIAKKDTLITTKNLEWAKQQNKLNELALYSSFSPLSIKKTI